MEAYIYDAIRTVRGKGNKKGALIGVTPSRTWLDKHLLLNYKHKHQLDTTSSKRCDSGLCSVK